MSARLWMGIGWPAFLVAGLLEMVVFAFVDPGGLHWGDDALPWSAQAVYTLAFFVFWGLCLVACGLTALLVNTPAPDEPLTRRSAD